MRAVLSWLFQCVFRVSELKKVLKEYSVNVENGMNFLTKDMGEDRWLCTLLIQKGCRLEYSAVSQDSTYCPDTSRGTREHHSNSNSGKLVGLFSW